VLPTPVNITYNRMARQRDSHKFINVGLFTAVLTVCIRAVHGLLTAVTGNVMIMSP